MLAPLKGAVFSVAAVCLVAVLSISGTSTAHAAEAESAQPQSTVIPLEIEPACSDATKSESYWKVTNKNEATITFEWDNFENNESGTFAAVNGESQLVTYYNSADPNNTTRFTYDGQQPTQTNAQVAPCQPIEPPVQCIDASIKENLIVTPSIANSVTGNTSTVTVSLLDNRPACEDTTIFLTSYTMPDNYDGSGFGGPTSYPQSKFDGTSITFFKDQPGAAQALSITIPDECKNKQIDLYYSPEITNVDQNGHGTQLIDSEIIKKVKDNCKPTEPENPGNGDGNPEPPVTPPTTPETPVTPPAPEEQGSALGTSLPAQLPATGPEAPTSYAWLYALVAAGMTYAVAYAAQSRKFHEQ